MTARISTTMLVRFEPDRAGPCTHLDAVTLVTPSAPGCEDCLSIGMVWVHLRICMTCGHVGCCDRSRNRHARAHHERSGHPIVRSVEPGESWGWCYLDDQLLAPAEQPQPSTAEPTTGTLMPIVRHEDRPVHGRGPRMPTLQRLVDRANGSEAVTVLRNVFTSREAVPEHTHEVEEVLLVTAGECIVTVAGQPEVARTGDAVIITPGTRHAIHHDGDEPCEVIAVLASPDAHLATAE